MAENDAAKVEAPKAKRQKIAVACEPCRSGKVRCDGVRPVCGVCSKRKGKDGSCRYTTGAKSQLSQSPHLQISDSKPTWPSSILTPLDNASLGSSSTEGSWIYPENRLQTSQGDDDPFHGVDSMTGAIESRNQGFFGSSSASSFMKQIKTAVYAKAVLSGGRSTVNEEDQLPPAILGSTDKENRSSKELLGYDLPSRRVADRLFAAYWDLVYPLYPFLDKGRFVKLFDSLWTGNTVDGDEHLIGSICNVVFALSCQLVPTIKMNERESLAKVYFARAQNLLQLRLWDLGSIDTVRCLLLMSQYLQSTSNAHECWMVVGHAVRIAQGLGLHLPKNLNTRSVREREHIRIVWHGCVFMDRVLSMTFGRPAMISKQLADNIPHPTAIDDQFLPDGTEAIPIQPEGQPATIAIYVKSLKLYDIVDSILLKFYSEHNDRNESGQAFARDSYSEVSQIVDAIQLDRTLMNWAKDLPAHLRFGTLESSASSSILRRALICRLRFLHTRILVLRPVLALFCLPQTVAKNSEVAMEDTLDQRMANQCSILCLQAAHEIVELIFNRLPNDGTIGPLPAWWYCMFYIYTAATVLLASCLRQSLAGENSTYSIADSWHKAIRVLQSIEYVRGSAQRCLTTLEILSQTISSYIENENEGQEQQHSGTEYHTIPFILEGTMTNINIPADIDNIMYDPYDTSWLNSLTGIYNE